MRVQLNGGLTRLQLELPPTPIPTSLRSIMTWPLTVAPSREVLGCLLWWTRHARLKSDARRPCNEWGTSVLSKTETKITLDAKTKNSSDNGGTFMGNTKSQNSENNIFLYLCVGEGLTKRYWPENTEKKKKKEAPPNDPERSPRLKVLWAFIHFAAIIFCT